jgi:DNA ligase-1
MKKTLYKRNTNGSIQEWTIVTENDRYWTTHGQVGGALVTSESTVCQGKNQGRANETTAEEQAEREALAKITKQIKQGHYHESIDDVDEKTFVKVMLASTYEKVKDKMSFEGALISPKLDGIRCVCSIDGPISRTGKPLPGMKIIFDQFKRMFDEHPELILDGEGYNHKLKDDFNEIVSLIKKDKHTLIDIEKILNTLEYHVYDVLRVGDLDSDTPYVDRMNAFSDILSDYPMAQRVIKLVPFTPIYNHDDITEWHNIYTSQGYEGAIVRYNRGYENKRSKWLIKVKKFTDKEFEIVEIMEGKGNRAGMAGKIKVKLDGDGAETFKAGIKGGEDFYRELWENRNDLVGKMATVKFFSRNPATMIPRFPVCTQINRID